MNDEDERFHDPEMDDIFPLLFPDITKRKLVSALYDIDVLDDLINVSEIAETDTIINGKMELILLVKHINPSLFYAQLMDEFISPNKRRGVTAFLYWYNWLHLQIMYERRDGIVFYTFEFDEDTMKCNHTQHLSRITMGWIVVQWSS